MRWVLKFCWICSRGYGVMAVLSWGGLVTPKFSAPPSGETMHQNPKIFGGARMCSRSSITMPSLVGLGFHPPPGWPKTLSFLSVRLFVCLFVCPSHFWTSEIVRPISLRRHWNTETILMPLDRGKFVVVHPCSTLSACGQMATTLNAEVQKRQKLGFSPTEGDRINRSRRNLARKCIPWVCYSTLHLAFIGRRGSVQEPPKGQNLPKIVVFGHRKPTQWTHSDEIWHVSADLRPAVAHQIRPSSAKGGRYRSPQKCQNLPKIVFFCHAPEADTMNTFRWNLACQRSTSPPSPP